MKVIVCSNDQSTCVTDVVCKYNVINIMCVKMASHLCDRCDKDNVINIITRRDSLSRHMSSLSLSAPSIERWMCVDCRLPGNKNSRGRDHAGN